MKSNKSSLKRQANVISYGNSNWHLFNVCNVTSTGNSQFNEKMELERHQKNLRTVVDTMITTHNIGKQKGFSWSFGWINITFIVINDKFRFTIDIIKGE